MEKFSNLGLGAIFKLGSKDIKIVKYVNCEECFINQCCLFNSCADLQAFEIIPNCLSEERADKQAVMF